MVVERNMSKADMRGTAYPAGVEEHVTRKRNASEVGRSQVRPVAKVRPGPHREGEKPKPMMNERGKSDTAVGAMKPGGIRRSYRSEGGGENQRAVTKGSCGISRSTRRAQERESVSQALGRIRQAAKQRKKEKFTTLFHHISVELLRLSFFEIKKDAAPGVDGLTWQDYELYLDRKIDDLHDRVQRGAYRAQPSRRLYIPKPDGRQRPIAIAALEDKIVQRATAAVLSTISMRRISSAFRMGSAPSAASTMRWTPWWSGSPAQG